MTYIIPQGLRIPVARTAVGAALLTALFIPSWRRSSTSQEAYTCVAWCAPDFFGAIYAYVAQDTGLYKVWAGRNPEAFNSGVGAARAVVSGAVDVSMSPTPPVAVMVSNAGVPLVMVQGMEINDWMLGSMDPAINSCEKVKGVPVGVDSPRGASGFNSLTWFGPANCARTSMFRPSILAPTLGPPWWLEN